MKYIIFVIVIFICSCNSVNSDVSKEKTTMNDDTVSTNSVKALSEGHCGAPCQGMAPGTDGVDWSRCLAPKNRESCVKLSCNWHTSESDMSCSMVPSIGTF